MRTLVCGLTALLLSIAPIVAETTSTDVDIVSADGAKLRATYTSPGTSGPAMLLIHQCNLDRTAWKELTDQLVGAGVHVLAMDLRGFGESPGEPMRNRAEFQALMQVSPPDVDAALDFLLSQDGVDSKRVGAGGASCGAMLTADLAARNDKITTLMLLSGTPSEEAREHIAGTKKLAVFTAATRGDDVTPGVANWLEHAADSSPNRRSTAKIFDGTEHGLPMFEKNPSLGPDLIDWLKARLTG